MPPNKKGKNPVFVEDFSMTSEVKNYADAIIKKSIELGNQHTSFQQRRGNYKYISNTELETFTLWLPYFQQANDVDLLKGELEFIQLTHKTSLLAAPTVDHFFKSYNFFKNTVWPCRIANRIVGKFSSFNSELKKHIVGLMGLLLDGYVFREHHQILEIPETPMFTKFFMTRIGSSMHYLIWMIGVERIPKLTFNKKSVQKFEYVHYMKFLDVIHTKAIQKGHHTMACARINHENRKDPARQEFGNLPSSAIYNRAALFQEANTFTGNTFEFIEYVNAHVSYAPNKFRASSLTDNERSTIIFDSRNQRWKTGEQMRMFDSEHYRSYQEKMNKETIRDKASFKNASQIVEFLKAIPNFRIKLTPEQNAVVGQAENVVALGRSGTGKTTCAILRLFAMEILFKFRMTLAKLKAEQEKGIFTSEDIDNVFGLHCIFVTASPVLSSEVQRYYHRLTGQVKEELKNKQKRIMEKRRAQQAKRDAEELEKAKQEGEIITDKEADLKQKEEELREEALETLKMAEEGIKDIQIENPDFENQDQDMIDEEEADQRIAREMERLNSLRYVSETSFPLFLTVKRLVLLIDGCMTRPFFARNIKDQIIGLDSNAQWHNEMKGVMMIGNYHKKMKDFNKTVERAEKDEESDLEGSDEESDEELEEDEFHAEYEREMNNQARERRKNASSHKSGGMNHHYRMSFEVEYEYFETHFWKAVVLKKTPTLDIHPLVVWSEIQSNIKGSANSHLYSGYYLPLRVYEGKDSQKKNFLTKEKKALIFDLFGRYERWKRDIGAYDFMDVVNYTLAQIRYNGYTGAPIHYLMIDEVQDLTHATILLFMRTTTMGLFFSGDTAQTIAKGVGMRFSDLKGLFQIKDEMYYNSYYEKTWKEPVVKQLTVNFRSHGKILELANSVVTVIETFFPKTIDKLRKEKSEIDGPKPILLADVHLDALFALLFGNENNKSARHSDNKGGLTSGQIEFGCNQVIIVRDQESKDKLPPLLKHALVLTVYEAKGLEFDDVILYNFFSDSEVNYQKWRLLDSLEVQDILLDEFEYNQNYFTFENEGKKKSKAKKENKENKEEDKKEEEKEGDVILDSDDEDEEEKLGQDSVQLFNASLDITTSKYLIKKVGSKINKKQFDMIPYSSLCTELKQLYVAITRPKNRLIIYDENIQNRKYVEDYWRKLDLVQVVSKKDLESDAAETNPEIASFKALVVQTAVSEWKKQGVRMFKNKYYEQAIKCFEKSGDSDLKLRATAYHIAEKTSSQTSDVASKMMYVKERVYPYNIQTPQMRRAAMKELKEKEKELHRDFVKAAQIFEEIGLLKHAAQCYFSAQKYGKALATYEKIELWKQAAEAAFMMKDYEKAAMYYDKGGDYLKTIECLAEIRQYERILEIVDKYKEMPSEQRENFAKRYVPLALKALLSNVDYNIEDVEEIKQDEKKKKAGQQQNVGTYPARIEEEDEDEEEDDEEDDESEDEDEDESEEKEEEEKNEAEIEKEGEKAEKKEGEEEEVKAAEETNNQTANNHVSQMSFDDVSSEKQISPKKESKKDVSEMSFEMIGSSKNTSIIDENAIKPRDFDKSKANVDEMSFDDIASVNSKANVHEKLEDFEHLSHIDPEDEWLRMETGSIIEKLSAIRRQDSASMSDYSAIDYNHVMNNQCTLVKTKNDIFLQDNVMQKIIRYISLFSNEVKQSLYLLRSKKTLLTQNDPSALEQDSIIDVMVDLDDINTDFIYLILDLLEHYKLYKLCIFVCNRYGLSKKLGRYLVNIASRYSNFAAETVIINKIKLLNPMQRQIQNEKAFIASLAFHNVLENINPEFLRLKNVNEVADFTNSLGHECYAELVNLGFWKKCLFLMDYESSLALASTFASFKNFKLILLTGNSEYNKVENINNLLANENFEFLPFKTPSSHKEVHYCQVALDAVLWDLTEKFPIYIQKNSASVPNPESRLELPPFESYFAFNGILWSYVYHRSPENAELFEKYLADALSNLSKILKNSDFKSNIIELRIYDLIVFLMQLMLLYPKVPDIEMALLNLSDEKFEELVSVLNNLLIMTKNILRTSKFHETILRALITPFRIRFIEKCKSLEHLCNSYFVTHVSSPLLNDIITFSLNKDSPVENPSLTSVPLDLDNNFIATPINVALNCVRKRIVNTMKNLVSLRIKTISGNTYDESAEKVERYIHLVGLIECFRLAIFYTEENKTQGSLSSMYAKPAVNKADDHISAGVKNELKKRIKQLEDIEQDDSYEPEERDILVAGIQREIKKIKDLVKTKAIKLDNQPFEAQKTHYLKAIKRICQSMNRTTIRMNPFVRQAILSYLFQKVTKGISKGRVSLNYANMFYMLGEEVYLTEILRKYKNQPAAKNIQLYCDAIAYRKFYCVDDYANNLFDYISAIYGSLNIGQRIGLLADLTPMILASISLKDKKKSIKIAREIVRKMEDLHNGPDENTFILKKNIIPAETYDNLSELSHWIEKVSLNMVSNMGSYGEAELSKYTTGMLRIVLSIIACNEKIEYETLKKLKFAIKHLVEGGANFNKTDLDFLLKYSSVEDFTRLSKELAEGVKHPWIKFSTIVVESNPKKAEEELDKCDQAYLKDQVTIAKHINLKKAILKLYNKNSFAKIKAKINFDSFEHNYILNTFNKLADQRFVLDNIFNLVKKNSGLLQLFYDINNVLKRILVYFFHNKLENPLDFHYIMNVFHTLARSGAEYSEFIRELTVKKNFSPENNKIFVTNKVQITELEREFNNWMRTREVKENLNKTFKKKRVVGVKWEERALKAALKKPAKKTGAKKQQLLQEKKEKLKAAK